SWGGPAVSVGSTPGGQDKQRPSRRTPINSAPLEPPGPLWRSKRLLLAGLCLAIVFAIAIILVATLRDDREGQDERAAAEAARLAPPGGLTVAAAPLAPGTAAGEAP